MGDFDDSAAQRSQFKIALTNFLLFHFQYQFQSTLANIIRSVDMNIRLLVSYVFIIPVACKEHNHHLYELVEPTVDINRRKLSRSGVLHFYALGDVPYIEPEVEALPLQMAGLSSNADFVMHVGDLKTRSQPCRKQYYNTFATIMERSLVPVFNTIGDNDVIDCEDVQNAYSLWHSTFKDFDNKWIKPFQVRRQLGRMENFAFEHNGVFVIGLHVLHTNFTQAPMMYDVVNDTLAWWMSHESSMTKASAVVVFGHTYPEQPRFHKVKDALTRTVATLHDTPFLYIQGEKHSFVVDNPIPDADNFLRVIVDKGGIADPLEVLVDSRAEAPFKLRRRAYLSES